MPKAEWGVKRTCPNCDERFYDLQREPIICPECGATFAVHDHGKVSATRERRAPAPVIEEEDTLVDDEDIEDEDDAEAVDEPLLADDDEDEDETGPVLSDEDEGEVEAAPFKDTGLIEDGAVDDEVEEEDDEDDVEDLDDLGDKRGG